MRAPLLCSVLDEQRREYSSQWVTEASQKNPNIWLSAGFSKSSEGFLSVSLQ